MALSKVQKPIFEDSSGIAPAPGATCSIFKAGSLILATLYTTRSGVATQPNPVVTGSDGLLEFYVDPGRYDISVTHPSGSQSYDDFLVVSEAVVKGPTPTAEFETLAKAIIGETTSGTVVDWADYNGKEVRTVVNNSTSKEGGANYIVKTLAQAAIDGDVIDGNGVIGGNHAIDATYCLIKIRKQYTDIYTLGAINGADIAPVLLSTYTDKFTVNGSFLCSTVTRDSLDIKIISSFIDAPNSSTDDLFLNVRELRIAGYGHSEIGVNEPYLEHSIYTESGNVLDVLMLSGDIIFDGGGVTTKIIGADSGVSPTADLTVHISDGVEVKNFTTSGIDFRCDAMTSGTVCYVGNIKSHSGGGRCIQFGDNTYGVNQVTIEDCPKVGFVSSSGSSEAKGVLLYGRNCLVHNVKVTNVKNESISGGEGIYLKAAFSSVTNCRLVNAGSSSDGCITLKGASYWGDTYPDEGGYNVIIGNTVEMTSDDYDSKGIGAFDSNTIVSDNILRDLRPNRATLAYSESISIGGSSPVSNVSVCDNIVTGWHNFIGDYAESLKGRCRIGDNIKITNNTVCELLGGYALVWDARCQIATRPMTFSSSGNTITIDGGTAQNGEFERFVYPAGSVITVSGTSSNDGDYTISAVDRYVITVIESLVDESVTPVIERKSVDSLKFTGNTITGFGTGIRNSNGKVDQVTIDGNDWLNGNYAYRLTATGGIGELNIGANETWTNLLNKQNGDPVADTFYKGVKVKNASGGTMTVTSYEVDYDVAYT